MILPFSYVWVNSWSGKNNASNYWIKNTLICLVENPLLVSWQVTNHEKVKAYILVWLFSYIHSSSTSLSSCIANCRLSETLTSRLLEYSRFSECNDDKNRGEYQEYRSSSRASSSSSHVSSSRRSSSTASSISSEASRRSLDYFSRSLPQDTPSLPDKRSSHHPRGQTQKQKVRKREHKSTDRGGIFSCHRENSSSSNSSSIRDSPPDSSLSLSSSGHHPSSPTMSSFEWLPLEYWERSPACREAKLDHMDRMDHFCDANREYLILQTTLFERDVTLETNMFPYDTPRGIEHWTLWSRADMTHEDVCKYVNNWLCLHMPHVCRWNYDDNSGDRSIDLFHVHVYIETIPNTATSTHPLSSSSSPLPSPLPRLVSPSAAASSDSSVRCSLLAPKTDDVSYSRKTCHDEGGGDDDEGDDDEGDDDDAVMNPPAHFIAVCGVDSMSDSTVCSGCASDSDSESDTDWHWHGGN